MSILSFRNAGERDRVVQNSAMPPTEPCATKRITVIHHSASGGTRELVVAFCKGATACNDVETVTRSAEACSREDLLRSDVLVFATPENFGYMAGSLKAMFDRLFYACMADTTTQGGGVDSLLAGRAYATMVCAGNDGRGATQSIDRIVTGWRVRKVHDGLIARRVGGEAGSSRGSLSEHDLARAVEMGELMASGVAIGAF